MSKTLKKTLSIIVAILMIVTTIPFAFAAEDDYVAAITIDGETTYYETFPDVRNLYRNTEITIDLLADVEYVFKCGYSIAKPWVINLNGHTMTAISNNGAILSMGYNAVVTLNGPGKLINAGTNTCTIYVDLGGFVIGGEEAPEISNEISIRDITAGYITVNTPLSNAQYLISVNNKVASYPSKAFIFAGEGVDLSTDWFEPRKTNVCRKLTKTEDGICFSENVEHNKIQVDAKAPTCTQVGNEAYEYCTTCDYTTYVELPAITHTDANCDYKCDYNCGYEYETLDFSDAKVLSSDADGYLCIDGVKIDEDSARSAQYLPTGKYKLEGDIISNDCIIWILAEEQVIINLNGYKWTLGDSITLDGELSLYDLSEGETGKIVASTNWGNVNMQEESSVLNLYSGTLESTGGYALRLQKGNANLYGGKLKSDKYVIRNNVVKGNKGIDIDGTVLECGDGYAQISCSSTSNSVTESFIDVSDYTGDYLTVEFDVKKSGKYTIFEGIKNAQEADKYSIDVKCEERYEIFFDKTEYDEATGEKCVYIKSNAFVQQASPANNYTVGFSNPDASFQWYEVEETSSRVHTAVNGMTIYTNNFKAGDILKVSTDSEIRRVILASDYGSLDLDEDTKTAMIKFDTDVTVEFVPSVVDAENPVELEFSIINETLLDGATGKTLKNPEFRKEYYCKATVGKFVYTSDIVAGHYIVRVDAKAPTCTEIGWDAYIYCIACNYTTYVEKEALNHKDTLVQVDAKAPTCTEIGWDAYEYCTACDFTTKVEIPVDPDAHDYTNHYCKRCGKAEDGYYAAGACGANGDNLNWSLDSDGVLTISGEGEMQEMFIYLDQPWKDYRRDIKEVVIEEGVTKIAEAAFYLLTNLEKVTISSTAEFEDFSYCFIGCSSLKEFIVSPANPYYCTDEYGVVFSKDKSKLIKAFDLSDVDYVIPDTVTSVAEEAFAWIKIKSIIVNFTSMDMVVDAEIGKLIVDCDYVEAFAFSMTRIEEIVLTNKVSFIGYSAFGGAVITSAHYLGDPANLTIEANENESLTDVLHYCEHKEALAPTCTEIGWEAYEYCTECDYTTKVEIPVDPDAHDIIIDKAVAPDCTNTGLTDGQHCSRCNNATIAQEVIPALNHKDTLVKVNAKAPTCTEIGWDAYEYCTACEYSTYVEIPENGHIALEAVKENEVDSKCGVAGSYDLVVYCACGEELDRDTKTVDALKHSFTKYEVTEEAKCGVAGKEVATCDNGCGETDEKAIEALRHSFTKYEETEAPKCGVEGKEVAYCDNGCGATDEKAIEALKHDIVIDEAVAPKCGETGLTQGEHCTRCDYKVEQEAVPALTHKDADGDYKCDNGCGHEFEKPVPEEPTPDTPDEPTDDACDHLCHKDGFMGFIWKIVKFFSKLFKINPVCECGAAHY